MNAQFKATNQEEEIVDNNIECLFDGSMRVCDLEKALQAERIYYPEVVEK